MSNIVSFAGSNLPAVSTLSTALRKLENEVMSSTGMAFLKMDKTGHWVFGSDQTEVEEGSIWAVNPYSFIHGFVAWGAGTMLGELMVPVSEPLPETPAAPEGAKKGWEPQLGMALKCTNGEDEGLEVRYTVTSKGGKDAVKQLAIAIAAQVDKDPSKPVPMVKLSKDHYTHREYGRIYTPVFEVVEWVSINGEKDAPAAEPEAEAPAEGDAPRRRRRVAE